MPKTAQKPQNPNDEPAVRAAFVTRKGTITTAAVAAAGAILVALIGLAGKWNEKRTTPAEKEKFIVKVIDQTTGKVIRSAKVSLEGSGLSSIDSTDSEGGVSFPIGDPKKELRVRVEAERYENYNVRVTPADITGAKEIGLTPVAPTPVRGDFRIPLVIASPVNNRSIVRGRVIDESGMPVQGARVSIDGHGSFVTTNAAGNFEIPVLIAKGKNIDLHVEKEGYKTRTQQDFAGNDSVKILLRRQ